MQSIRFGDRTKIEKHPNTLVEFDRDISFEDLETIALGLARSPSLVGERVCYVFGFGAHPKSTYSTLNTKPGIQLVSQRSVLRGFARLLVPVVASYQGLVKIVSPSELPKTFLTLVERSMAGIYCFDQKLEQDFLASYSSWLDKPSFHMRITQDPGYSLFVADADSPESSTGIIGVVSYGRNTPKDLIPIL